MFTFEKGDCVIYTGVCGQLINGAVYLVTSVFTSPKDDLEYLTVYGNGDPNAEELTYPVEDFYPLREFNGNDEYHPHHKHDKVCGVWDVPGGALSCRGLIKLCTEDRLKEVSFDDIGGMTMDLPERMRGPNCICCGGQRFLTADVKKPLFLIEGLKDPHQPERKYRCMDGKHRIEKLRWLGYNTAKAYVIHIDEATPYLNH